MKPINTFDDAKQAVAEMYGVAKFYDLPLSVDHGYWAKAADLYAQQVANEAVKADRATHFSNSEYMDAGECYIFAPCNIVTTRQIMESPLPFPEES